MSEPYSMFCFQHSAIGLQGSSKTVWGVLTISSVGLVVVEEVTGVVELAEEVTGLEVGAAVVDEEVVTMGVEIIS